MTLQYLSIAAAAELTGLSEHTLRRMVAEGLPVRRSSPRKNSRILIRPDLLDEWMSMGPQSSNGKSRHLDGWDHEE